MLVILDGEVSVLFWAAVTFRGEEFNGGLGGGVKAHGIAAFGGGMLRRGPERGVLQAGVKTGEGKGAEGKGGEEAGFGGLVLLIGGGEVVGVVDVDVGGEVRFCGFVEGEGDLESGCLSCV